MCQDCLEKYFPRIAQEHETAMIIQYESEADAKREAEDVVIQEELEIQEVKYKEMYNGSD